jgi:hypothetical protein
MLSLLCQCSLWPRTDYTRKQAQADFDRTRMRSTPIASQSTVEISSEAAILSNTTSGLLSLPAELRETIWQYALHDDLNVVALDRTDEITTKQPPLTCVSRQVREETLHMSLHTSSLRLLVPSRCANTTLRHLQAHLVRTGFDLTKASTIEFEDPGLCKHDGFHTLVAGRGSTVTFSAVTMKPPEAEKWDRKLFGCRGETEQSKNSLGKLNANIEGGRPDLWDLLQYIDITLR